MKLGKLAAASAIFVLGGATACASGLPSSVEGAAWTSSGDQVMKFQDGVLTFTTFTFDTLESGGFDCRFPYSIEGVSSDKTTGTLRLEEAVKRSKRDLEGDICNPRSYDGSQIKVDGDRLLVDHQGSPEVFNRK